MQSLVARRLVASLVAAATAVLILAAAIAPFLTSPWLAFAQERAQVTAWTGYSPDDVRIATDALVHDLILGPPAFDVTVGGEPVLSERERAHLRDVRAVFGGLALLAGGALVLVLVVLAAAGRQTWSWRAIQAGARGLLIAIGVLAVVAFVAFDRAFEVFHQLFFAGGTYTFDPARDRLVQLFPDQLWFETSLAVGVVMAVLALLVGWFAGRRAVGAQRAIARPPDRSAPAASPVRGGG